MGQHNPDSPYCESWEQQTRVAEKNQKNQPTTNLSLANASTESLYKHWPGGRANTHPGGGGGLIRWSGCAFQTCTPQLHSCPGALGIIIKHYKIS